MGQDTMKSACEIVNDVEADSDHYRLVCGKEAEATCVVCDKNLCEGHLVTCEMCQRDFCNDDYAEHTHESRGSMLENR